MDGTGTTREERSNVKNPLISKQRTDGHRLTANSITDTFDIIKVLLFWLPADAYAQIE